MHTINRKNFDIEFSLFVGWKSAQIIHLVTCFAINYFVLSPICLTLCALDQLDSKSLSPLNADR
jgi:hypothetical protein